MHGKRKTILWSLTRASHYCLLITLICVEFPHMINTDLTEQTGSPNEILHDIIYDTLVDIDL